MMPKEHKYHLLWFYQKAANDIASHKLAES